MNSSTYYSLNEENISSEWNKLFHRPQIKAVDREVNLQAYRTILLFRYEPFKIALAQLKEDPHYKGGIALYGRPDVKFSRDWMVSLQTKNQIVSISSIPPLETVSELWPVVERPNYERMIEAGIIPVLIDVTKGDQAIDAAIRGLLKKRNALRSEIKNKLKKISRAKLSSVKERLTLRPVPTFIPHPSDGLLISRMGMDLSGNDFPWGTKETSERLTKLLKFVDPKGISIEWLKLVRTLGNKKAKTRLKKRELANEAFTIRMKERYTPIPADRTSSGNPFPGFQFDKP